MKSVRDGVSKIAPSFFRKKMMKKDSLTNGNIIVALIGFVVPIILGSLIQQLYITTDAVIIGQFVGKNGLAAVDSVHTLFKFPLNFMNGLAAGATIFISQFYGAKDKDNMHCCIRTAITISIILGILCTIAGVAFAPNMLVAMSVPSEIFNETLVYTRIYFGAIWAMVIYNMAAGILRAFGDSKRPLYVLIFCSITNVLGDLFFIGFMKMSVAGASVATVVAQIISAIYTMNLLANSERELGQVRIWHLHFCKEHMQMMLKRGLPLALQSMLFPVANSIVQASINLMGVNQIAAWGLCDKLDMLIWLTADAMSPALTTFTSQNIGARKIERVKKGVVTGVLLSVICTIVIGVILFVGTGTMGRWFVVAKEADEIVPLAVHYMRMLVPFFFFYSIAEALSGACCSMGDTAKPMLITLICMCLLRVVSIWIILPKYHTMECIACIYIASWVATAVAFIIMFVIRLRKVNNQAII